MLIGLLCWLRRYSVCLQCGRPGFRPWVGKITWRRKWQTTPELLPGKSHGQRSLVGYSPWGRKESDTTEQLHFHFQNDNSHSQDNLKNWKGQLLSIHPLLHRNIYFPLSISSSKGLYNLWLYDAWWFSSIKLCFSPKDLFIEHMMYLEGPAISKTAC